jgi:hypothetical protein
VPLPGLPAAGLRLAVAVALVETARLLARGCETAALAVLVYGVDDPVDAGVHADGLVLGVDADDLIVLVGGVLVDPVRVENPKVGAATANTLLSRRSERALVLELVHTLVRGLACSLTWIVRRQPHIPFTSKHSQDMDRETYHKWHPWEPVACGRRGGLGCGK